VLDRACVTIVEVIRCLGVRGSSQAPIAQCVRDPGWSGIEVKRRVRFARDRAAFVDEGYPVSGDERLE